MPRGKVKRKHEKGRKRGRHMSYWKVIESVLLSTTSDKQVNSSGFPVAAAIILIGLIVIIAIWDTIKARRGMKWTDEMDETDPNKESDHDQFWE